MNLITKLIDNKNKRPRKTAVKYFKNKSLYSLSWEQTFDHIEQIYKALDSYGIQKEDKICIYSDTCKEWGFLDLAIMAHQAVSLPLYHSSNINDINTVLYECEPDIIFIQNEALYKKICNSKTFQDIKHKIIIQEFTHNDDSLITFSEFLQQSQSAKDLESAASSIKTHDLATIIYTSGTSGRPKGVKLNHEQIISSSSDVFPLLGVTDKDCSLTFLPFSHVLGRMELWGHYYCGYTIGYAESIERIKHNLLEIKPTVLVGVPRIFEKIYFGIKAQVEISKLKKSIFNTAVHIGKKSSELRSQKKAPSLLQAIRSQVAHQLVFTSIQKKMGGNLRFAISGGAPLEPGIADFFSACGISVLEGYGLTETTGPIFINTLFEHRTGSVGKAIGDVELRFDSDNEILIRSKKVMQGYFQNFEDTERVFTEDGFFRTGDIGELDSQGFLKITDRKKDLIKTAGGKFIAPQKLQNLFATQPLISHIHIHGDKKKYVVALLTLEPSEVMKLKQQHNISSENYSEIIHTQSLKTAVRTAVAAINSQLASFETIKRFHVLDHEFTIEGGQLTPSLKMKRKNIDELYQEEINQLYS